jgi:hypothetical protein
MLPLITAFKLNPMRSAPILTVALGMIACTNVHSNGNVCIKDSSATCDLVKRAQNSSVVNGKAPVVNAGPELPFYKDVLDTKRLFW